MIDYAFIGARLKEARIRKNMTQEQLAAMTDVGSTHISHIETGMTIPSTKLPVQIRRPAAMRDSQYKSCAVQNQFTAYLIAAIRNYKRTYLRRISTALRTELPMEGHSEVMELCEETDFFCGLPLMQRLENERLFAAMPHLLGYPVALRVVKWHDFQLVIEEIPCRSKR